jgi:hypothetical protein
LSHPRKRILGAKLIARTAQSERLATLEHNETREQHRERPNGDKNPARFCQIGEHEPQSLRASNEPVKLKGAM